MHLKFLHADGFKVKLVLLDSANGSETMVLASQPLLVTGLEVSELLLRYYHKTYH